MAEGIDAQHKSRFLYSSFDGRMWLLALLGIGLGVAASVIAGQFGWLVLLVFPGLIVLSLAVSRPDLGLSMLLIVIFAQVQRVFAEINGWPGPGRPLVAFVLGIVLLRFFVFNERPMPWIRNSFVFVIYAIFLLVSVVTADNTDLAFTEFQDVIQNMVIASMILFIVQKPTSLKTIIWAIILAGLFMSSVSVFQNITKTYDNNYFGFGGWEYSGYVGRPRMTGPYETPNPYAQVLAVIFILALERGLQEKDIKLKLLGMASAGVCALALIFTDSRGGFLNFVFTIFVFLLFNRPSINTMIVMFALGMILLRFLPANFTERLFTLTELVNNDGGEIYDESFRGRTSENIAAWRMFLDNPVFGVGLDNYSQYYLDYSRQIGLDNRREQRDPASLYLQLLATQGLFGTIAFFGTILYVFIQMFNSYKVMKISGWIDEASMTSGLFAALAGYMFMSIYKNSANTNVFWSLVAICLAVTQVVVTMKQAEHNTYPVLEKRN